MKPATRLIGLQESVIREMTRLAYAHDALNLSQGYPDFPAPEAVKEAAIRAIQTDRNQYTITWGLPELRQAVARYLAQRYGMDWVDPDRHVTITCGVTEAIVAALMGIVNPGDEVVIIEPFHENYPPAVAFAGGTPVFVPLEPPDFRLDAERLREAFTPRTRAIILNTPHNPTGRVFTREELRAVAELCREFDVIAVTDEIYEHILYDGCKHIPLATLPGMTERTVTTGGWSKTFAVTGWRLGYAVAPEPWSTALRTVHDYTTICAPTPLQAAAVVALGLPESYYAELREGYAVRRERMLTLLRELGFQVTPPEGAYYVMADFRALGFTGDDVAFARWLVREARVAVVPGSSFYHTPGLGRQAVRFAFPKQLETLEEAYRRMREAFAREFGAF